jgi:hypothetical protein
MLSKIRCPHTGVINFFTPADPWLSVGSVAETGSSRRYVWRCYVGKEAGGLEPDIFKAEARLRTAVEGNGREHRAKAARKVAVAHSAQTAARWRGLEETDVASLPGSRR